jgi:hypothetical protein
MHLPWSTPPLLKRALLSCRDEQRSYELDLDLDGSAADTQALLAELPAEPDHVVSLVFGKSAPVSVRQHTLDPALSHWVLLRAQGNRILARELERPSKDAREAPSVAAEGTVHGLSEEYAWLRDVCTQQPCAGVILTLSPNQKNSTIQVALEAIRTPNVPAPLLDLRDAEDDSNELERRGSLPPAQIKQVIRDSLRALKKCYEYGLLRNPKLEGRVSVRFVIELDGSVHDSTLDSSTLPDDEVARCVVNHMTTLRFPEPDGGTVTVVNPMMFTPEPAPAPAQ